MPQRKQHKAASGQGMNTQTHSRELKMDLQSKMAWSQDSLSGLQKGGLSPSRPYKGQAEAHIALLL